MYTIIIVMLYACNNLFIIIYYLLPDVSKFASTIFLAKTRTWYWHKYRVSQMRCNNQPWWPCCLCSYLDEVCFCFVFWNKATDTHAQTLHYNQCSETASHPNMNIIPDDTFLATKLSPIKFNMYHKLRWTW